MPRSHNIVELIEALDEAVDAPASFTAKVGAVPMVPEARSRMSESAVLRDLVVLDAAKIDNMVKLNPAKIDLSRWNEEWNRTVAR